MHHILFDQTLPQAIILGYLGLSSLLFQCIRNFPLNVADGIDGPYGSRYDVGGSTVARKQLSCVRHVHRHRRPNQWMVGYSYYHVPLHCTDRAYGHHHSREIDAAVRQHALSRHLHDLHPLGDLRQSHSRPLEPTCDERHRGHSGNMFSLNFHYLSHQTPTHDLVGKDWSDALVHWRHWVCGLCGGHQSQFGRSRDQPGCCVHRSEYSDVRIPPGGHEHSDPHEVRGVHALGLSVATLLVSLIWAWYALWVGDLYIAICNNCGVALGIAQVLLYARYWRPADRRRLLNTQSFPLLSLPPTTLAAQS